jgi:NAD(P)H-hydrate epimerase
MGRAGFPRAAPDTNKGTYGHLLVVAGSRGKTGAGALAGLAALRSGVGLCTVATPADALSDVQGHAPELMGVALPTAAVLGPTHLDVLLGAAEGKDALVIGPGIPRGPDTHLLVGELLLRLDVPVLIDADALNAIAGHAELLQRSRASVVLTPHPGEMARLTGKSVGEIQANRLGTTTGFARAHRAVVVLKGARTVVADARGRPGSIPPAIRAWQPAAPETSLGHDRRLPRPGLPPVDAASAGCWRTGSREMRRLDAGDGWASSRRT